MIKACHKVCEMSKREASVYDFLRTTCCVLVGLKEAFKALGTNPLIFEKYEDVLKSVGPLEPASTVSLLLNSHRCS